MLVLAVGLIGCTSISATPPPTVSIASPTPEQSVASTVPPSVVPTSAQFPSEPPVTTLPTTQPTLPPTATPAPTKTTKPATANLVVTKFELDADYLIVEQQADFVLTVKNAGTADAGPFSALVAEANLDDGTQSQSDPHAFDGLGAGKSAKVTFSIALPKAGHWQLTATADSEDVVDESNEKDNGRDLSAKVLVGLPDLAWANGGGFSMTPSQTQPGSYTVGIDYINVGTDDLAQETAFIGITWFRDEDSATGALDPFPIVDLAKGAEQTYESLRPLPGSGTYTIYAYLDRDHVLNELSTDNNETSIRLTVP